jgi:hypothetical protein
MRASQIPVVLEAAVREHFPKDVADAIAADTDGLQAAIRNAGYAADTPEELTALIGDIAAGVDDRLADWLMEQAQAPAAWLARQIRDH